ncbi:MAG: molybdopterin-dependent oxidoreductase [Glaciecola sp.]|nr:molybdopterin-dependent oxidoreductase [Glaciecola sp.]
MTHTYEYKVSQTTCPYCGVGCGVDATVINGQLTEVSGNKTHPANFGKLCVKGSNLDQTVGIDGRLLNPMINGENASWDDATQTVADKFRYFIDTYGPDSVAFYVSGQILTEDYYVANKLMKGYIGSANIDTNSRLCMASAVAGYKRAFGSDTVPCSYADIDHCELLILVGSNAAWTHPILYQRMEQAKLANPNLKVIVVDPRKTATEQLGDLHLTIQPGTDVALFNGLLHYLMVNKHLNQAFIEQYTEQWDVVITSIETCTLGQTALVTGVSEADLRLFYQAFAATDKPLTFYSQGVNQSSQGTDKCNAIINCHLATGTLGHLGAGPFSITGQPNAMGGREVGGLANTLAGHMNIEDPAHRDLVQTFWQSPNIPHEQGAKAVDLFAKIKQSKIKAVWIMATNPMVSLPNRAEIAAALTQCEFVVVSDCVSKNDTLAFADVALPATTWAEKDGTVTNSERRISRQKGILTAPGQAKHDWQALCDVAKAMGYQEGFNFVHPVEVFNEHAALSGYRNSSDTQHANTIIRDFDISGLASLTEQQYDNLLPIQWPVNNQYPQGCSQMFADKVFFTPSKKAQFVSVQVNLPQQLPNDAYPLILNSGRMRDQWHTMTRTGKSSALAQHTQASFIALSPQDATQYGVADNDLIRLSSPYGEVIANAQVVNDQAIGQVFMPIHWNQTNASHANVSECYGNAVDPISGQPESKYAVVALTTVTTVQHAVIFTPTPLALASSQACDWWNSSITAAGMQYNLAWFEDTVEPLFFAKNLATEPASTNIQWHTFTRSQGSDDALNTVIGVDAGQITLVALFGATQPTVNANWIVDLMTPSEDDIEFSAISALLSGAVPEQFRKGKTICSCFQVGENDIINAITQDGCDSVSALGETLQCGTNCGSCKSELASLVDQHASLNQQSKRISRFSENLIPVHASD